MRHPFDKLRACFWGAQQGNEFHRPLGLVNRHSFEARRTQRRVLFSGESGDGDSPEASQAFGQISNP